MRVKNIPYVDVLILGGTRFLGVHLARELLARGHVVTLFTTGRHANPVPQAQHVTGTRERDLARLGNRRFDAVIDTCGYVPGQLETSVRYFLPRAAHYVFISSISAQDVCGPELTEATPVLSLPEGASRSRMLPQTYGALKALCENVAVSAFRHRALIVRPGLIVGPHDPTDRFTYWPLRIARGGDVLAPVGPHLAVQFIDARDLAAWIALQVEARRGGTFNVTGKPRELTLGDVLHRAMRAAAVRPTLHWASESFLNANGVGEWIEMPLWISAQSGAPAMLNTNVGRALATGLRIRPLDETVADTLAWARSRGARHSLAAGLDPQREGELLRALGAG